MNIELQEFARERLINGLKQLPESNQLLFKRMYSHNDLALPIENVVENMLPEKLDWAMQQVQRTMEKQ